MPLPSEVFLSHASADRVVASKIAEVMRDHGVPVWYSATNILGGQDWHDQIGAALTRCDWFAVILSPDSVKSMWVNRELIYALQQARFANRIVPILHKPCDAEQLSWTLSAFQFVDLSSDYESGCRDLLRTWGIGYNPK